MSRGGVVHLFKLDQSSAILMHARRDSGGPPTAPHAVMPLRDSDQAKARQWLSQSLLRYGVRLGPRMARRTDGGGGL